MVTIAAISLGSIASTCSPPTQNASNHLRISGSNTVMPFAVALASGFHMAHSDVSFRVSGDGTARGIKWAGEGQVSGLDGPNIVAAASVPDGMAGPTLNGETVDIGMSSRALLDEERESYTTLVATPIATDSIAVATPPGLGVTHLTRVNLRDIYAGRVTDWSAVGGPALAIVVIVRPAISGTAGAWQSLVMGTDTVTPTAMAASQNADVAGAIAANVGSIGYLSLASIDTTMVTPVSVDGIAATEATARDGTYPLIRPFLFVTNGLPSPLEQRFLDYTLSSAGAAIIRTNGAVPLGN